MVKRSVFRRALPFFMLVAAVCVLTSCNAAEGVMSRLGFDTHNYRGEKTLATHMPDSEVARELAAMMNALSVHSPYLTPFSGAKEAAQVCRDAVLNRMLSENYARYAGNTLLLAKAAQAYPQMQISVLIPADDFESIVYASFGGSEKITNKDGDMFRYLDKIDAYTTAASPQRGEVVTTVTFCEETERTYRLRFRNSLGDVISPEYFALIIRREDGSLYIRSLEETGT